MSASRLRVLQVTPRYAPDNGGVESHVEHLSLALLDHGVEVTVALTGGPVDGLVTRFTCSRKAHISPRPDETC